MENGRVVLLVMVGLSAVTDIRQRRIPNALTLGGAACALLYRGLSGGFAGLGSSVGGWAVGLALFMPMYLIRGMGAGDVKLLGAVGAWVGPTGALWSAFYTVLAGGLLALVMGAAAGYLGTAFRNLWTMLAFWRATGPRPVPGLTLDDARGPRLPYGLAIALGTAIFVLTQV
jgi:prepilin peptidase CpaA